MPVKRRREGRRVPKRVAKKQKVHTSRRSNDAHSESSSESENSSVSSSQSDHSEGEDNGGGGVQRKLRRGLPVCEGQRGGWSPKILACTGHRSAPIRRARILSPQR
jgi:hypothetical protein